MCIIIIHKRCQCGWPCLKGVGMEAKRRWSCHIVRDLVKRTSQTGTGKFFCVSFLSQEHILETFKISQLSECRCKRYPDKSYPPCHILRSHHSQQMHVSAQIQKSVCFFWCINASNKVNNHLSFLHSFVRRRPWILVQQVLCGDC